MAEPTLIDLLREWIGDMAWGVYLWARGWTEDEYRVLFTLDVLRHRPQSCEHGYNGLCPTCDAMQTPQIRN